MVEGEVFLIKCELKLNLNQEGLKLLPVPIEGVGECYLDSRRIASFRGRGRHFRD